MPKKGKAGPGLWFRLGVAGLAAVATLVATAASVGGNGHNVTVGGPSGCVVLRVNP